nr:truncated gag protein [Human immunodeficiency virus 1]
MGARASVLRGEKLDT